MMYRAGWASKEHQQNILAITLPVIHFKTILQEATISSYKEELFATQEIWKEELGKTEVRLQWDPDHDPYGSKQERKAIQLGMKGELLKKFCIEWIVKIEDITDFVKEEHQKVLNNNIEDLNMPIEKVIDIEDSEIERRIGITKF
jgi:hypothetical protein